MQGMRHWMVGGAFGLCAIAGAAGVSFAGANAGGVLLLYAKPDLVPSTDATDYTGQSGLNCPNTTCDVSNPPFDCNDGRKETAMNGHSFAALETPFVFFLLAAFPEESCPNLAGVVFGINYDLNELAILYSTHSGDFELQYQTFPDPGSATAVTWNAVNEFGSKRHLVEVYNFVAVAYAAGTLQIQNHPTQGYPTFATGETPAELDDVGQYPGGTFLPSLGFGGAAGNNGGWTPTQPTSWGQIKSRFQN